MPGDRLMSIGGFAQQCGLSVPALRYYDEIELLEPTSVDPSSGYRRYHPDQLATARQIYILRALELPIEAVREVVSQRVSLRAAVETHRDRHARQTRARPMSAQPICRPVQITIHAHDLPRAVQFYGDVFGGEFKEIQLVFRVRDLEDRLVLPAVPGTAMPDRRLSRAQHLLQLPRRGRRQHARPRYRSRRDRGATPAGLRLETTWLHR